MRKFTNEQIKELQTIMTTEFEEDTSIEDAAMAAHNLHELYDVLHVIARKLA